MENNANKPVENTKNISSVRHQDEENIHTPYFNPIKMNNQSLKRGKLRQNLHQISRNFQ